MPSYLTWLDYSEKERRKMLDIIDTFRETDTIDELGLGSIRDAIADRFFPGTGTVQTRARYLFFISWMYMTLEGKRVSSAKIADRSRSEELRLIERLLDMGETEGVIGRVARRKLRRLPSNIYWLGLEKLGVRRLPHGLRLEPPGRHGGVFAEDRAGGRDYADAAGDCD